MMQSGRCFSRWIRPSSYKGSHRIYGRGHHRLTVPFHSGACLHPKIVKQVLRTIEEAAEIGTSEE